VIGRRFLWLAVVALLPLSGCARVGSGGGLIPQWTVRFTVEFASPVDDRFCYYFIAIDADNDFGLDGPLPVAAGPWWGNGWGTGSITHFIEYHQGQYNVFRQDRMVQVLAAVGGIVSAAGSPVATDTGVYTLTARNLTLGQAAVAGSGPVTSAVNQHDQNAGTFNIATDGAGQTVPDGVTFTPAADGGRPLTDDAEQTALDALNAGGVLLTADSLSAFGLRLTIGAPAAGTETIEVEPTVGEVQVVFRPNSGAESKTSEGTVTANSNTPTATPPIPGVTLRTQTLLRGGRATLRSDTAPTSTPLGPPYQYAPPSGGDTLDVTIDQAMLGAGATNLSVNIITTTQVIFDPRITDPAQHCYDGLGADGNQYVNFPAQQTRTISNGELFTPERDGDPTLPRDWPPAERASVDIIDWTITIQRLGG